MLTYWYWNAKISLQIPRECFMLSQTKLLKVNATPSLVNTIVKPYDDMYFTNIRWINTKKQTQTENNYLRSILITNNGLVCRFPNSQHAAQSEGYYLNNFATFTSIIVMFNMFSEYSKLTILGKYFVCTTVHEFPKHVNYAQLRPLSARNKVCYTNS